MKIAFLGDVALFGKFDLSNKKVFEYFLDVKDYLSNFDLVVANLEAPFVSELRSVGNKSACIYSDVSNVSILKYLGVNIVCLANNHIFDFGTHGLEETIRILENNDIDWFGIGGKEILIEKEKIAMHSYCSYNTNPLGMGIKNGVSCLNFDTVVDKFLKNSKKGLFNVVCNHSGVENVNQPSEDDIKFARYLSTLDTYLYIGHHPHVIQGCEVYNSSHICYSLGNFCFDDIHDHRNGQLLVKQSEHNKVGLIKSVEIIDGELISSDSILIYQSFEKMLVCSTEHEEFKYDADRQLSKIDNSYSLRRNKKINVINSQNNSRRDLVWLLSRMEYQTITRVLERKINKFKYKK
ncbi:CapA family protein, partial [Photobacterium swingsii]